MDKRLDDARSDATAILGALGVLAVMASKAEDMACDGVMLSGEEGAKADNFGSRLARDATAALKSAREGVAKVLEDLGEFFNGGDACGPTMEDLSTPVFDALHKRAEGVSLED